MKKTLVASALAAVIFVPTASAIEIYKDDKNAVAIGGWVDARIINTQGETEIVNGSSRINFEFTRDMGEGWRTFTKLEWGVNPFGNTDIVYNNDSFQSKSDEFLNNRHGFVGLGHEEYGYLTIGKQWGVWYDVVNNTNLVNSWDGNASGTYTYNKGDGSVNGTGRGDKTVQYRNSFGDFSFGLQAQLKNDTFYVCNGIDKNCEEEWDNKASNSLEVEYNYTYGGAATYQATDMLTLTAGFNLGEFEATTSTTGKRTTQTDSIYGAGLTWGGFEAPGFYAAFNVNKQKYHDTDNMGRMMPDAIGLESLFTYKFDNGLKPIFAYNYLKAGDEYEALYSDSADSGEFKRQFIVAGLHYVWDLQTMLYVEVRKDFSEFSVNNQAADEDDAVAIGIRYYM